MIIYKEVKRFDPVTGKPVTKKVRSELRCDFTGNILHDDDEYCRYNLDYQDQDPCFGSSGHEYQFGVKYEIDMYLFLSGTYCFASVPGSSSVDGYAEAMMMREALENYTNPDSDWHDCLTFDAMCRASRVRTAKQLIEEGEIKPQELMEE